MNCPNCDTKNTAYSSKVLYGSFRSRYYKCKKCNTNYTTRFHSTETLMNIRLEKREAL